MCKQRNEAIGHFVSLCPKLAQKKKKKRHENVGRAIQWDLARTQGLSKMNFSKPLWDVSVRTDHEIRARRPDFVIIDKKHRSWQIVEVAISGMERWEGKKIRKIKSIKILQEKLEKRGVAVEKLATIPINYKTTWRLLMWKSLWEWSRNASVQCWGQKQY